MKTLFSRILREFLKDNCLSQKAFAVETGIPWFKVNRWANGNSAPDYDELRKISETYDISADYFLGLSESY